MDAKVDQKTVTRIESILPTVVPCRIGLQFKAVVLVGMLVNSCFTRPAIYEKTTDESKKKTDQRYKFD